MDAGEYIESANEGVLVLAQIETRQGVENAEKIAAVPGIGELPICLPFYSPRRRIDVFFAVDVLFIGPFDLSLSLGYPPPLRDVHPEVEKVIARVKDAAHSAGKYV